VEWRSADKTITFASVPRVLCVCAIVDKSGERLARHGISKKAFLTWTKFSSFYFRIADLMKLCSLNQRSNM